MTTRSDVPGPHYQLTFQYDWMDRRIRKTVVDADIGQTILDLIFLYDGWNLIAEVDAQTGELIGTYVWGLDLSGSFQGAGGIGGLLWVNVETGSHAGRYVVAYDGNGNVMGLVSADDGSLVAQYEYGPFAEPLRATGPLAADNPFRFSTKYTDPETGLIYYGHRYYSPSLGRWLSRDWLEEAGGPNLYGFVHNTALEHTDWIGLTFLWDAFAECSKSIAEKAIGRFLDKRWACESLFNRIRGTEIPRPGEQDAPDIDLCKGFTFQPYWRPGYKPESLTKLLKHCLIRSVKNKAIGELLKEIRDPIERRLFKKLLSVAGNISDIQTEVKLFVEAKCKNKKLEVRLKYGSVVKDSKVRIFAPLESIGPFGCQPWLHLNDQCECCD